jgi:hypothetical protein
MHLSQTRQFPEQHITTQTCKLQVKYFIIETGLLNLLTDSKYNALSVTVVGEGLSFIYDN